MASLELMRLIRFYNLLQGDTAFIGFFTDVILNGCEMFVNIRFLRKYLELKFHRTDFKEADKGVDNVALFSTAS